MYWFISIATKFQTRKNLGVEGGSARAARPLRVKTLKYMAIPVVVGRPVECKMLGTVVVVGIVDSTVAVVDSPAMPPCTVGTVDTVGSTADWSRQCCDMNLLHLPPLIHLTRAGA